MTILTVLAEGKLPVLLKLLDRPKLDVMAALFLYMSSSSEEREEETFQTASALRPSAMHGNTACVCVCLG